MNVYIRKGVYPIDFVLDNFITESKEKKELNGVQVKTNSHRYLTFFHKGITCVSCGIKGEFFALEKDINTEGDRYHFNLYAKRPIRNGKRYREVLMTKDHIFPVSLGGKNHIDNYQTMCERCNLEKGNKTK